MWEIIDNHKTYCFLLVFVPYMVMINLFSLPLPSYWVKSTTPWPDLWGFIYPTIGPYIWSYVSHYKNLGYVFNFVGKCDSLMKICLVLWQLLIYSTLFTIVWSDSFPFQNYSRSKDHFVESCNRQWYEEGIKKCQISSTMILILLIYNVIWSKFVMYLLILIFICRCCITA